MDDPSTASNHGNAGGSQASSLRNEGSGIKISKNYYINQINITNLKNKLLQNKRPKASGEASDFKMEPSEIVIDEDQVQLVGDDDSLKGQEFRPNSAALRKPNQKRPFNFNSRYSVNDRDRINLFDNRHKLARKKDQNARSFKGKGVLTLGKIQIKSSFQGIRKASGLGSRAGESGSQRREMKASASFISKEKSKKKPRSRLSKGSLTERRQERLDSESLEERLQRELQDRLQIEHFREEALEPSQPLATVLQAPEFRSLSALQLGHELRS
jgi:hypothetical protein